MTKFKIQNSKLWSLPLKGVGGSLFAIIALLFASCSGQSQGKSSNADTIALAPCPRFSADSALLYIKEQCAFGSRVTGSDASRRCGDFLVERFKSLGAEVEEQTGIVTIWDGTQLPARNIIASINPSNPNRILLCAHWDCRPWADNDPDEANHHRSILAANDGASGVAVMLEICRLLQKQPVQVGVDFICFDAEDMGTPQWAEDRLGSSDTWCLGSHLWAERARTDGYKARYGVLLDMVGGYGATFSREGISMRLAQPLVNRVWQLAGQLGYRQFFPLTDNGYITDDHINVNKIAGVPCIDIIPYYSDGPSSFGPTWHTIKDTPENIDTNVLEAVGQTITQLIYNEH
ncbi:MAG: M28 family peptidase [Bacteroidaceae bacterium]|nr:M28 family peptidase [Bacteroidaceae bacterium]